MRDCPLLRSRGLGHRGSDPDEVDLWAGLKRLPSQRELLSTLLRRELRAKYKGSAVGVLWSYLYPLLMMGVYTLVFSVLWRVVTIEHYPLFVLSGLAVWAFFQASVQAGVSSLPGNARIIKKVWFPREVIPMAAVFAQALSVLAVMFAVLVPDQSHRRS